MVKFSYEYEKDFSREEWAPLPPWEGYEVSSLGRVRSVRRSVPRIIAHRESPLEATRAREVAFYQLNVIAPESLREIQAHPVGRRQPVRYTTRVINVATAMARGFLTAPRDVPLEHLQGRLLPGTHWGNLHISRVRWDAPSLTETQHMPTFRVMIDRMGTSEILLETPFKREAQSTAWVAAQYGDFGEPVRVRVLAPDNSHVSVLGGDWISRV